MGSRAGAGRSGGGDVGAAASARISRDSIVAHTFASTSDDDIFGTFTIL